MVRICVCYCGICPDLLERRSCSFTIRQQALNSTDNLDLPDVELSRKAVRIVGRYLVLDQPSVVISSHIKCIVHERVQGLL